MKGAIKCAAPKGEKIADLGTQVAGRVRRGSFTGIRDGRSRREKQDKEIRRP